MIRLRSRDGATLVEVMLAGAVLLLMTLTLFEGLIVSARITKENSEHLAADAYASDTAWRVFNWSFEDLKTAARKYGGAPLVTNIASNEAPVIYHQDSPAQSIIYFTMPVDIASPGDESRCLIEVDVAWGPPGNRKLLSDLAGAGAGASGRRYYAVIRSSIDRGTAN